MANLYLHADRNRNRHVDLRIVMMQQYEFPFDDDSGNNNEKLPPHFQPPTARNDDLETSYDAAHDASFHASEGRILALRCLMEHGPCTDYELAAHTGWQQNSIGKRRLECQRAGLIRILRVDGFKVRRPAPSGSDCFVWELTPEGRDYIKDPY